METQIRDTSIKAYNEDVKNSLGERQRVVYDVLKNAERTVQGMTNSEISAWLDWPINTVTPRIFELREMGLVEEDCKRSCRITGRTAYAWRLVRGTLF